MRLTHVRHPPERRAVAARDRAPGRTRAAPERRLPARVLAGAAHHDHADVLGRLDDRLVATLTPGPSVALRDSVTDLEFDYLLEPGAESRWVKEWVSPVTAPVAIRLRVTTGRESGDGGRVVTDTLLFLIKERG